MATTVLGSKCGFIILPSRFVRAGYQIQRYASADSERRKMSPVVQTNTAQMKRGTGGRSSFSGKTVTVFGASGFLGRAVVNQLGKIGSQVIVAHRGDLHFVLKLKLCGDLGQIHFQPYHLKDEESLRMSMKYSNVVINLIGRNHETGNFPFEEVHVKGPRNIAKIAREYGVETLIHVSALNACEKPDPIILKRGSQFYASKWRGEQAVREEFPNAIIFRPSDIFGTGDRFCTYYAMGLRHTFRTLPLWKKGVGIIKQPVFQSDLAQGIIKAVLDHKCAGQTYQAVGPHRYELSELVDWFHRVMMKTEENYYYRTDLRYDPIAWAKVYLSEKFWTKVKLLTWERLERDHTTDVVYQDIPTLEDLGVELTPLEERIFFELQQYRAHAYADPLMQHYIRDVKPAPFATG